MEEEKEEEEEAKVIHGDSQVHAARLSAQQTKKHKQCDCSTISEFKKYVSLFYLYNVVARAVLVQCCSTARVPGVQL